MNGKEEEVEEGKTTNRIYRIHPRRRENGRAKRKGGKKEGKRERRTKKLRYRRIIKLYNEEEGEGEGVERRRNEIARR